MGNDSDLRKAYNFVHSNFFPKWRKRKWRFFKVPRHRAFGTCDGERKIICVRNYKYGIFLFKLLIHEICHAVTNSSHGKKWLQRYSKAAERAKSLGYNELAEAIQVEVEMYKEGGYNPSNSEVYDSITDCVFGYPTISFKNVVNSVSRQLGMSDKDFLKKYVLSKKVFLDAKKDAKKYWNKISNKRSKKYEVK